MKTSSLAKIAATALFLAGISVASYSPPKPVLNDSGAKYDRSSFNLWVDEDKDCQNTRTEVLIRDADGPLKMSKDNCRVLSGTWVDPYTGKTFTDPLDLDIDHVEPLKNAFDSGANLWDKKKRQAYANYLGNNYHLLAVSASENRKKGDKSPDKYLPPNKTFDCEYIKIWVEIMNEWKLKIRPETSTFIKGLGCKGH